MERPAQSSPSETPFDFYQGGSGPTLVLLHGLSGTWHIWKPVIPLLETRFHVVVPTLPGHWNGPALPVGAKATVPLLADTLIAALRSRGIERAHVAGNSLGGWLSLELARRGFARSVVAFSPAGAWDSIEDYRKVMTPFRIIFFLLPLLMLLTWLFIGFAAVRRALVKQSMEHGERISAAEMRLMLRGMRGAWALPDLLDTMGVDGPVAAMETPVPTVIAWGQCDQVIPFERYGRPMLRRISGAEARTVAGVGHVPMYDDPQAVVAEIVRVTVPLDNNEMGEAQPC